MLVEHQALTDPQSGPTNDGSIQDAPGTESGRAFDWMKWFWTWTPWDWVALVLPLLAVSPLLATQVRILWNKQHMQFFPLAIAAVAWFVARDARTICPANRFRTVVARLGVWANIGLIPIASIIYSSWLAHLIGILGLFYWMLGKFGNLSVARILGISGLALITVPFPFHGDQELVRALQRASSLACSRMMDALNILHVRTGNVLEISGKQLFVEEACSGVDSQYALMAVAGILLLVGRASVWVSIVTILTVPIWAILGNILRIFFIVLGFEFVGIDLSVGWQHMLLGSFAFAMAAWAHWSSVQFLNWLEWTFGSRSHASQNEATHTPKVAFSSKPISVSRLGLASACAMIAFAPMGWALNISGVFKDSVPDISETLVSVLPGKQSSIGQPLGLQGVRFETVRRNRGHQEGQCSQVWRVMQGDGQRTLSMDLPFRGGHPLWACYTGNGWTISSQRSIDLYSGILNRNWPAHEMIMRSPDGSWATLHFVHVERSGLPFDNSATRLVNAMEDREKLTRWRDQIFRILSEKFSMFLNRQEALPLTVQFQLLAQGTDVPSADEIEETRQQFQSCRERFLMEMQPAFEHMRREFD